MTYFIYDEFGDLIRKSGSRQEARYLLKIYQGWTMKAIKNKPVDLSHFGEAPF
jgi:hypothetical protein